MEYVSFTLNGSTVSVPKGTKVLDAAIEYGICIPHLCHMDGTEPFGACRLCLVEVIENGRSRFTASCTLKVQEGMVVESQSEKVVKARRIVAEMLVAEAPNSRAIQDIAVKCGVKNVRFSWRNNDCVLCGRCIWVCREKLGIGAIGFAYRGFRRMVTTFVDEPMGNSACHDCRECGAICPVVALVFMVGV